MSDESSDKVIHAVAWGCGDGDDVVCYVVGTKAEAERSRDLLRVLHDIASDDRFTYQVRDITHEDYAEEIADLEDWEADPEELDGLIERVKADIVEAAEVAKCAFEDEIGELDDEIEELRELVAAKKAAIAAIDLLVNLAMRVEA